MPLLPGRRILECMKYYHAFVTFSFSINWIKHESGALFQLSLYIMTVNRETHKLASYFPLKRFKDASLHHKDIIWMIYILKEMLHPKMLFAHSCFSVPAWFVLLCTKGVIVIKWKWTVTSDQTSRYCIGQMTLILVFVCLQLDSSFLQHTHCME